MDKKTHTALSINKACQHVGSQSRLAHLLNISPSAVSHWLLGRRPIPAERCPEIEKLTHGAVKCEELRPDVDWKYLRGTVIDATKSSAIASDTNKSDRNYDYETPPDY